jgi:hypothetical protein
MTGHSKLNHSGQRSGDYYKNVPPPIKFNKGKPKKEKTSDEDKAKLAIKTLEFSVLLDANSDEDITKSNSVLMKVLTLESATPEQYCMWRASIDQLLKRKKCTSASMILTMYQTVFAGNYLKIFNSRYEQYEAQQPAPAASTSTNENTRSQKQEKIDKHLMANINRAVNQISLEVFGNDTQAYSKHKKYLTNGLNMVTDAYPACDPKAFAERLTLLNDWSLYFPAKDT